MLDGSDLLVAMVAGPDAYERAARGRTIDRLPTQDGTEGFMYPSSVRQEAEALGFVFGKKIDDLFTEVITAPDGWRFQSTDHALYTNIVDDKGRIRGQMGARTLYDTFANYHFLPRYQVQDVREEGWFQKWQPPVLTTKEKRRRKVPQHEKREMRFDEYGGYVYWGGKHMPDQYEEVEVDVPLPDAQQPKPEPYWQAKGIIDRETGEHIFLTDKFINPVRGTPAYKAYLQTHEEEEKKLWAIAAAELASRFPNHADVTAYWS